ncbi:aminodeoxychorismate lyase [Thalassotalea euphylliae]|uniref:Aminodeoxychorismate lyase n=1 Tax=Thalassotalea euphylliae TaxID=1655234 RepID=A0A3E0TRS1_9GAMM|nr:aminodeoxychorismate lyase [Thalassotalea euphylliae]REL27183.1 aminodeoxychorismate lyase [Thalassotalea euphylliae]
MSHHHVEVFQQAQTPSINVSDRAFAYGDGLFTTAKITNGKVDNLAAHLERLINGVNTLAIDVDLTGLQQRLEALASGYSLAVLKVLISAGEGGRGYSRVGCEKGKAVISIHDYPAHYKAWQQHGIRLGIAKTRLGVNPMLAGIKHLNRLEQVMVRRELDARDEDDLLVSNCLGNIVEVTAGNVFWLPKGNNNHHNATSRETWHTPSLGMSGVDGLARQQLIQKLNGSNRYAIEIVEQSTLAANTVESMLVCNSVLGIAPVYEFSGTALNITPVSQLQGEFKL